MQNGAVGAYWAHNPEVRGSKPRSAIVVFFFLQSEAFIFQSFRLCKIFFAWYKTIVLFGHHFIKMLWFLKEPLVVAPKRTELKVNRYNFLADFLDVGFC